MQAALLDLACQEAGAASVKNLTLSGKGQRASPAMAERGIIYCSDTESGELGVGVGWQGLW